MKEQLEALLAQTIDRLKADGILPEDAAPPIKLDRTKDKAHGDFASNLAMVTTKLAKRPPRELAQAIVERVPDSELISKIEIAGPGFINFFLKADAASAVVSKVLAEGERFGRSEIGAGKKLIIEFVSANPTGPLHVGHGRGAAFGGALAALLAAAGYQVHREYYVNDAGRQMDILAASVWLRYLEAQGQTLRFPDNGYKGDYIHDIAAKLVEQQSDALVVDTESLMADLPADAGQGGDKEAHIDAIVERARGQLGENYRVVQQLAIDDILGDIRDDLAEFGVFYDEWFSERSLTESGAVNTALKQLDDAGQLYEKDGALWFKTSAFGDEKDRVVRRENGLLTYFASDIAYHVNKLERGFDQAIDVWGADHHGYVPRVKAVLDALGHDPARLEVRLVQFAILYRGSDKVQMSTRSGSFVTLRELRQEVGNDACRFFYVLRKPEQHMDFDLELAKSESADNPVYYIQYAHARICSVFRELAEAGRAFDQKSGEANLDKLVESHEEDLINALGRYPEVLDSAARAHEPHQIAHYLRELANAVHTYYNAHKWMVDDAELRNARLCLVAATRQVIQNALGILGVSAPERM